MLTRGGGSPGPRLRVLAFQAGCRVPRQEGALDQWAVPVRCRGGLTAEWAPRGQGVLQEGCGRGLAVRPRPASGDHLTAGLSWVQAVAGNTWPQRGEGDGSEGTPALRERGLGSCPTLTVKFTIWWDINAIYDKYLRY